MDYKNAACLLPIDLLIALQEYADGEYIYIPRKAENKKQWGELKNSRGQLVKRNRDIFAQYQRGISVEQLAELYYLSSKTVYKILAAVKNNN